MADRPSSKCRPPHTERIAQLLQRGNTVEAARLHNEHLKAEFDRSQQGAVINLSDLMAAQQEFHLDQIRQTGG